MINKLKKFKIIIKIYLKYLLNCFIYIFLFLKNKWKFIKKFLKWLTNAIVIATMVGVISSHIWVNWTDYSNTKKFIESLKNELKCNIDLAEEFISSTTEAQLPLYKAQLKSHIYDSSWFLYQTKFSEETKKFVNNFYFGIYAFREQIDRVWLAGAQCNNDLGSQLFNNLISDQNKIITHGNRVLELLEEDRSQIKFCIFKKICF